MLVVTDGDNHGGHRADRHGALPHGDNHGGHRAGRHGVLPHGDDHGGQRADRAPFEFESRMFKGIGARSRARPAGGAHSYAPPAVAF